ncbi:MAG: bifunctional 4-hydroxy-3-methylbut-2-enyl diphosphate reductase/30S ribosomal protein S1 [Bacillota bacterium]|jgi:(E)-4-hydroxy-3-methyl-but-2-enyl pyrophosphate reductase|nr:bifunctional 4-hydroxy-3-methylbut-2-enyl diphosphate reductase/30S ribosomal protein S1 [Candidatus Fermentithermobacillaceae bacterium]
MLKIKVMDGAGYCRGVQRAMDLVEQAVAEGPHPVWTLGSVVHNPKVEADLAAKGVRNVDSPEDAIGGTLILRSHGTSLLELARIPEGTRAIDTTCPFVKRSQKLAGEYALKGFTVLLVGDPEHPEMKSVISRAGKNGVCVRDASEVEPLLSALRGCRVAVLAQTTARESEVEKVLDKLRKAGISVQSENTICTVTHERQEAIAELARGCQVVLVVGGRTSANTGQLLRIAGECGAQAYLVESSEDVSPAWFSGKRTVGIAAGASTPDRVIKEVVGKVEEIDKSILEKEHEDRKDEPEKEAPQEAKDAQSPEGQVSPEGREASGDAEKAVAGETEKPEEDLQSGAEDPVEDVPKVEDEGDLENIETKTAVEMYDESFRSLEPGQIIKGRVVSVDDKGALVDVGAKSEGLIPASELHRKSAFGSVTLSPGDEIMVYVVSSDSGEGGLRLSKRKADEDMNWKKLEEVFQDGAVIEAPVSQEVKGGLVVDVGLRGFVPASQVERGYVNDLSKYVGKTLRLKVLELDRGKNRVVLSQRVVLEEEHERLCRETWENIAEGQVRRGVVKGLTDFGVFVDLGGVDGLLHISELAWGRVKHPSEVVSEGEEIEVKVLRVDKEKGKISLGRKQVLPDPWLNVEEKYPVGSVVTGEVTRTAPFGAFVQLEPGVEGLVHISEVAYHHVAKPDDAVSSGDVVRVKVLRVRPEERRISLSIKQADQFIVEDTLAPEVQPEVTPEEAETPVVTVVPEAQEEAPPEEPRVTEAPEAPPEEPASPEPQEEPVSLEQPEEPASPEPEVVATETPETPQVPEVSLELEKPQESEEPETKEPESPEA